ncbi:type VII secretion integral membrane protein EccD [Mycobacterium talmoniae]|uniref:Type VII secretion integral membrane protein EccD n=1 Tax=Mycobacterium talmoniae TaxID=1858794 RepID=A0A1S1NI76_9MYCO|nr:type VII secretion integral membrane protein EccD [Mycobacterium talmoniae]OHV03529.1 type VII secretion integral membrane protein EccD [Mycobacterium talmoniae]
MVRQAAAGAAMITNVTVVTGSRVTDLSVPSQQPIDMWIDDVVDRLAEQYRGDDIGFDFGRDASWTITPIGGVPVQRNRRLDEAEIFDGALVMLEPVSRTERYRAVAEDVIDGVAILNPDDPFGRPQLVLWLAWWTAVMLGGVGVTGIYGWSAATATRAWWGPGVALIGIGCIAGGFWLWRRGGSVHVASALLAAGVVDAALGAGLSVPLPERASWLGAPQLAGGALGLLVAVLVVRGGPLRWEALAAFVGAAAVIVGAGSVAVGYGWSQYAWPAVVAVGLFVVRNAARLVIKVARIALPPIPAAGEDVDIDELLEPVVDVAAEADRGGPNQTWAQVLASVPSSSARLVERSVLSQHLLAGFMAAGCAAAAVGAVHLLTQGHFLVHTLVVCALVMIVLVFRSQLPADKRCVWALLSAAAAIGAGVGVKVLWWWPAATPLIAAAVVAVTAAVLAAVAASSGAPRMNAIRKRWLEWIDQAAVAAVVPLLAWIAGLFDFLRNVPWLAGS